ncbi:hypothetical protein PG994_008965 [Apiospora phragmitis]|uniref:Fumarylacetoacetase-like C-terminal domain-containing protein n=1 Tax=Apiospora phragmitis TaxID=2905665 RepID=A0ABR1UHZ8_9PEZI
MKYRRANHSMVRVIEPGDDISYPASESPTPEAALLNIVIYGHKPDPNDPRKRGLPFQPESYRDFMLFPAHYAGAAAGIAALSLRQLPFPFLQTVFLWLVRLWTWLTGTVFPPFRPSGLYLKQPIFYQSNHLSIVASGAPVARPRYCKRYLDVELELGCVLGCELYNAASPEETLAAIGGFVVLNDFSARDVQWAEMRSGFGPQLCKSFASSISAEIVSADEVLPLLQVRSSSSRPPLSPTLLVLVISVLILEPKKKKALTGRVIINQKVVAECAVGPGDWQFTLGEALAHASQGTRLYPGELFGSGTLPGGAGIENMAFEVQVGDTVSLEIDGVGCVTNSIIAEEEG